jgi:sulfur relay (sulfurtransferase) DsrC/TusE family protein
MDITEVAWNEPARAKILDDADRVLREAVLKVAEQESISSDDAFAQLNALLKDRFIDYQTGPDIRAYADAIAAGEFRGAAE